MKFKWFDSKGNKEVTDLSTVEIPDTVPEYSLSHILDAECFSKNGWYGGCFIFKAPDGKFYLTAGSMDSTKGWKSAPKEGFNSLVEAVKKAEELWRPV